MTPACIISGVSPVAATATKIGTSRTPNTIPITSATPMAGSNRPRAVAFAPPVVVAGSLDKAISTNCPQIAISATMIPTRPPIAETATFVFPA